MHARAAAVLFATALVLLVAPVTRASAPSDLPVDPTRFIGTWDVKADTRDGLYRAELVVKQGENGLAGSLTYESAPWGIEFATSVVSGDTLSFEFSSPDGFQRVRVTIDGDAMKGTSEISGYGKVYLEATRRKKPSQG